MIDLIYFGACIPVSFFIYLIGITGSIDSQIILCIMLPFFIFQVICAIILMKE